MKTNKPILIPEHKNPPTITGCWCNSPYHSIYWYKEEDDDGKPALAFSLFVNPLVGFWQRVKNAFKYIFNIGSLEFDEWRISNESFNDFVKLVDAVESDAQISEKNKKPTKQANNKSDSPSITSSNDSPVAGADNADEEVDHLSSAILASNKHFEAIIENEKIISEYYSDRGEDRPYPLTKYEAMKCIDYIDGAIDVDIATRNSFRKCIDKDSNLTEYIKYKDVIRIWGSFKKFKKDFIV